jgi:diguanylate cyclase (GGDEF)-like protein
MLLVDRLEMAAHRQDRGHLESGDDDRTGLAVLFLDLDDFKVVNDSRGHEAGDRLLVEVAGRLSGAVRETDTVARLGGDEFAVVCEDSSRHDAELVAQRIQEALRVPFDLDGDPVRVGTSIGIALSPPYPVADLLRLADAAMYDAKVGGRHRTCVYPNSTGTTGTPATTATTSAAVSEGEHGAAPDPSRVRSGGR